MTNLKSLDASWANMRAPIVDGIMFPDGRVVLLMCSYMRNSAGRQVLSVRRGRRTRLEAVAREGWESSLAENSTAECRARNGLSVRVSCGEGSLGGDGYVAATDLSMKRLLWLVFCTVSNPFVAVRVKQDVVIVESTLPSVWRIPLLEPANSPWRRVVMTGEYNEWSQL
jgi:hypothetical protein